MFEWDETKRITNLMKHHIDFLDAAEVFLQDHLILPARSEVEQRQIAISELNGVCISVIFTIRENNYRLISARKARTDERQRFQAHVAGRDS